MEESSRPHKRPRLATHNQVQKFESAFETSPKPQQYVAKPMLVSTTAAIPSATSTSKDTRKSSLTRSKPPGPASSNTPPRVPLLASSTRPRANSSTRQADPRSVSKSPAKRTLAPPPRPPTADSPSVQRSKPKSKIVVAPPILASVQESPIKHRPRPPPIPPLLNQSTTPLKPLKPPSVIAQKPKTDTPMTSITETRVAVSFNPKGEAGSTKLFELTVAEHGSGSDEVVWVSREERELGRGLVVSPEKAGKKKGQGKYIRGGLADNASRHFQSSRTEYRLWEMQLAKQLAPKSTTHKSAPLSPDLRLIVRTIIYTSPPPPTRSSSAASSHPLITLARCAVISSTLAQYKPKPKGKPRIVIPFGTPDERPPEEDDGPQLLALFRVDNPDYLRMAEGVGKFVKEGLEVWVWEPWMSVTMGEEDMFGFADEMEKMQESERKEVVFCTRYALAPKKEP